MSDVGQDQDPRDWPDQGDEVAAEQLATNVPDGLAEDVLAEIDRTRRAASANADADPLMSYGFLPGQPPRDADPFGAVAAATSGGYQTASRVLKTLEDVYETYPTIGDGSYHLRVERKSPASWNGLRIAGWLEDLHEQISLNEFANRYGGGTYLVSVRGPSRGSLDASGMQKTRTLDSVRIDMTGQPKMVAREVDTMNARPGFPSDQAQIRQMELAHQERERLAKERDALANRLMAARNYDPDLIRTIRETSEKRAEEARSSSAETVAELRRQSQRKDEVITEKEKDVQKLRERILEIQTEMSNRLKDEETRQVRELRERYESDVGRLREEHSKALEKISEDYRRSLVDGSTRHADERKVLESSQSTERERIRDDAARREKQITDDAQRQINLLIQTYESRLAEQQRGADREISAVREQRDREILSIKSSEESKSTLATNTSNMQVTLLTQEINRLRSELNAAKHEAVELRVEASKAATPISPEEAIERAHRLASITGFGGRQPEEDAGDWKKGIFQVLRQLVEKAPEIAGSLEQTRARNRQAVMQAQSAQQAQGVPMLQSPPEQIAQQQALQQQALMRQRQQRQQPAYMRPPPGMVIPAPTWDAARGMPPAPGMAPRVPPPPVSPIIEPTPKPVTAYIDSPKPKKPAPPPSTSSPAVSGGPAMGFVPPGQERTEVAEQLSEQQEQFQAPEAVPPQVTEEAAFKLAEQLDFAIRTGIVTPREFATKLVEEVGPEVVANIVQNATAQQVLEAISADPNAQNSAILTRDGRKFVNELWAETKNVLGVA